MDQESSRAGQDTDDQHRGDGPDHQQLGIGHSIRSGTAVPSMVLVTNMGDGSLFPQTWRDGPGAYLSLADAVPLIRELAAAFVSTALALRGQDEAL